ncbi:glycoprotein 3-alpha-L-fucosyltransferase A-like [Melanaphis sacchari]|uniref:glycoprotein 3-alpha-L-fucosyltransferase A-like n=1 Tax=Melanaphis sacchari TaxID=742174 RepID=UPI000DC14DA6|nr:glycoprotein 3-alpha-L-fucosyltransferase A-like [Melanaphis sacchari]
MNMIYFRKQDPNLTVSNADCTDNKFTSSRLVWPEQLPRGDRIKEQLYYIPKGYKYLETPIKRILIYTGPGATWETLKADQGEFIGCPVSQCWLTLNKSLGPEVDAVMFRHFYKRPEYQRPPNQIWILLNTEAPPHPTKIVSDAHVINWTANYRWDSDIPIPYGYFMKYNSSMSQDGEKNYAENKTKKVAWFVSNCNPNSNRKNYVNQLAQYISIDVYGKCGKLQCPKANDKCFEMLKNDYKFYLSFENSHCVYYVTEKFFENALNYDTLPIVMGPSRKDYELIAPSNSFIHVDDFESPKKLADYLHLLDSNHQLYNEYFRWKGSGTLTRDTRFYCRLCAMLHDTERGPRHYEDVNKWWRGPGTCN